MEQKTDADRELLELDKLDMSSLDELHWREERLFADKIRSMSGRSKERSELIERAYGNVSRIVAAKNRKRGVEHASAGFAEKHRYILQSVLKAVRQNISGAPVFFEVGFGSGRALEVAREQGFDVYGLEVNDALVEAAKREFGGENGRFFHGEMLDADLSGLREKVDVIYWNDVMEHIPPDEIQPIASVFHDLLKPGGCILTITPNWHVRPSDVTRLFEPPRSEAKGFHLKEYRLSEVMNILRAEGFGEISTPLLATRKKAFFAGQGMIKAKVAMENVLEALPFGAARVLNSLLALSVTLAVKR
jgi:SAM-dependent methyltransferase